MDRPHAFLLLLYRRLANSFPSSHLLAHASNCWSMSPWAPRATLRILRRHGLKVVVPKMDGLLHPEPVTVRVHAIQDEVLPANPGVEHLRHVCPHILEARLLRRRQGLLRALVVTAVELVHYVVPNALEHVLQVLASGDVVLEMARVIMDEGIYFDLGQRHSLLHHFNLVLVAMCSLAAKIRRDFGSITNCHPDL